MRAFSVSFEYISHLIIRLNLTPATALSASLFNAIIPNKKQSLKALHNLNWQRQIRIAINQQRQMRKAINQQRQMRKLINQAHHKDCGN